MAGRKGRHPRRKGPGGPRRTSRTGPAEVVPITAAPGARHRDGLLGPSVDALVRTLLSALRAIAPADPAARPIGIEAWADQMAATMYEPDQMPPDFYVDLAEGLLTSPDPDARPALAALALVLDHADAAGLRRAHADHRVQVGADDPSDLGIGRARAGRVVEIDHVQGDGVTLMIEVDQPGVPHTAGVYIDHTLGGLARDLVVGPPGVAREAEGQPHLGLITAEVDPAEARARMADALALTDHAIDPPVAEAFDDVRPLVERRMALLPAGGTAPEPAVPDDEEVEALIEGFLASPEAAALGPGEREEAGWVLEPWITHATRWAIGDPLRSSPALVEQFCLDWYPRHAIGDPATTAAAPAVLAAWIRYAARRTSLDDRWRDEALEAVAVHAPTLAGSASGGPGRVGDLDPDLAALGPQRPDLELLEADGGIGRVLAPFDRPDGSSAWRRLQPAPPGPRRVHWEADAEDVVPEVASKVKVICLQASHAADVLLGTPFVQPAVELAIAIGSLRPSPLPHTRDDVWSSAVVWLLADDSGAFSPRTPGRTRADLADALPASRPTITKRVTEVRDRLGLERGDLAVDW